MRKTASWLVGHGFVLLGLGMTGTIFAAPITFTKLVDTNTSVPCAALPGTTFGGFQQAALKNGAVAFHAWFGNSNAFEGIFLHSPPFSSSLVVATHSQCASSLPGNIGLFSFDGTNVAFDEFITGQPGLSLVKQSGSNFDVLLNSSDTMPGYSNGFGTFVDISFDNGELVWRSQSNFSSAEQGIYTYNGSVGTAALIGDQMPPGSGSVEIFSSLTSAVRDGSTIAFQGNSGFNVNTGIYIDTGSGPVTVVDSTTIRPGGTEPLYSFGSPIALQNNDVAFFGQFYDQNFDGDFGIYSTSRGLHTVADTATPVPGGQGNFTAFPYNPGVNGGLAIHSGSTVFVGREVVQFQDSDGIYVESGGNLAKVIAVGDTLDGDVVVQVWFTREGFDGTSLVFVAQLDSGRSGVFRADNLDTVFQGPVRGDQDGDGKADILFRNSVSGANQLYVMNGATIVQNLAMSGVASTWQAVGRGDYNGDGRSDILWRYTPTGALWIYFMDGATVSSSAFVGTVSDANWKVVGNGDYNGDGMSDILWHHAVNGTVWLYTMDGNVVTNSTGVGVVPNTDWQIVGSGDYNGDGRSDVLWRNVVTGTNWMYLMNGSTITTSAGIGVTPDLNWKIVGNGDYNGDGRSDILWRHGVLGTNWAFLMNGTAITTSASISVLPDTNWKIVGDGDYNGDGKADVLWRNTSTGANRVYLMDGLAITTNASVSVVTDQNWQVVNTR